MDPRPWYLAGGSARPPRLVVDGSPVPSFLSSGAPVPPPGSSPPKYNEMVGVHRPRKRSGQLEHRGATLDGAGGDQREFEPHKSSARSPHSPAGGAPEIRGQLCSRVDVTTCRRRSKSPRLMHVGQPQRTQENLNSSAHESVTAHERPTDSTISTRTASDTSEGLTDV